MTPEQRHNNMAAIHASNTKPEMLVRKFLWSRGYRYRVCDRRFPGKPDVVIPKYKTCIFVNGCFWHGHQQCKYFRLPKTNPQYWVPKIERNKQRDIQALRKIGEMGWHAVVIWECGLRPQEREATLERLDSLLSQFFLDDHRPKEKPQDQFPDIPAPLPMAAEPGSKFSASSASSRLEISPSISSE